MHLGFRVSIGLTALALSLGVAGCTGAISDNSAANPHPSTTGGGVTGGATSTGTGGGVTTGGGTGQCRPEASLAPARVWRITDEQYVNVVRQVFGVAMPPEITQASVDSADFTNLSELTIANPNTVFAYQTAARLAAQQAVTSQLGTFLPCGATPPDACVDTFIRHRVSRAFGRPLTDTEAQGLMGVYKAGVVDGPAVGARLVIEAALQSPSFLYRTELGAPRAGGPVGKVPLTPHEIATALSFALLDSVPDDTLWQRAEDGSIATPNGLASEVDRLLAMPEVQANLSQKAGFWLGVEKLRRTEKDLSVFPEFTVDLKNSLYMSAQMFVQDILAHGHVSDLLGSKRLYVNADLAKVYGIQGVSGSQLVPMDVQAVERSSGILSQPAVLAAYSRPTRGDPIHRGLFIYYSLACGGQIPPPPAGALDIAATFPKDATERQLAGFRADTKLVCHNCHGLFDPLGLTTERYDPLGRYHESDASGPIDMTSTILGLGSDLDGPVSGLPELVSRLKVGRRVSDCASTNLAVFLLGREVKTDDSCALQDVKDKFAQSGAFADFFRALMTSPAFVTRD
jgi:hypothetical protein